MTKRRVLAGFLILLAAVAWMQLRRPSADQLLGLWMVEDGIRAPNDPMHFYYFHKGGKGLYRYGWAAHNQTNSFDWSLDGDKLVLRFRKVGERATSTFAIKGEGNQRSLTLGDDPRGEQGLRYRFRPTNRVGDEEIGALEIPMESTSASEASALDGRMWIDYRKYATGGNGFSMYQFSNHAVDGGWKLGWHHRGDFDDWSTETMVYRTQGNELAMVFLLQRERYETTTFELTRGRDRNVARLVRDPRNFGAPTRFVDAGPSF